LIASQALLFMGRFEIVPGPPEHRSASSIVFFARDLGEGGGVRSHGHGLSVAVKLMADREGFDREVELRKEIQSLVAQLRVAQSSPGLVMSQAARLSEARASGHTDCPRIRGHTFAHKSTHMHRRARPAYIETESNTTS
jgi:hypothetical protein